jgi:hypothetical protein
MIPLLLNDFFVMCKLILLEKYLKRNVYHLIIVMPNLAGYRYTYATSSKGVKAFFRELQGLFR